MFIIFQQCIQKKKSKKAFSFVTIPLKKFLNISLMKLNEAPHCGVINYWKSELG